MISESKVKKIWKNIPTACSFLKHIFHTKLYVKFAIDFIWSNEYAGSFLKKLFYNSKTNTLMTSLNFWSQLKF